MSLNNRLRKELQETQCNYTEKIQTIHSLSLYEVIDFNHIQDDLSGFLGIFVGVIMNDAIAPGRFC